LRKFKFLPLFLLFALPSRAQTTFSTGGNITSGGANCTVATNCVTIQMPSTASAITVTLTGTFTATLLFEKSGDNGITWATQDTQTTPGLNTYTIASLTNFRVRASAFTSGNIGVFLNVSAAAIGSGSGGAVASVFGRTGTVTAQTGDYSFPLISGSLAHAQLPTLLSADIPNNAANTSGLAATATALAATPTNCGAGVAATGVAASGNAVGCFTPSGGGSGTVASGTVNGLAYYTASTTTGTLTPPSVNGIYNCVYNVTASATVAPTCVLSGIPVNTPSTPYPQVYSDRGTFQRLTGGTTFTFNLMQITGNGASNYPFVIGNGNSGNLTLTANAADKINNSATGGSSTVPPGWLAYVYQDSSSAPGNWWPQIVPTLAALPPCGDGTHALSGSPTTGFGCQTLSGGSTLTAHSVATVLTCAAASASGTTYTCTTSPTFTPADGDIILFQADVANTGAMTLNVNSSSAAPVKKQGGGTALVANDFLAGQDNLMEYDGVNWQMQGQTGNAAGGAATGNSVVNITPVTVAASVTTTQTLQELSLAAGYLNSTTQPWIIRGGGYYSSAATAPTLTFAAKLCTVSGCGSGTVVTIFSVVTGTVGISAVNAGWNVDLMLNTITTGASGTVLAKGFATVDLGTTGATADTVYNDTNTAASSAIALTGALFLDFTVTTSSASASNSITEEASNISPQVASTAAGGSTETAPSTVIWAPWGIAYQGTSTNTSSANVAISQSFFLEYPIALTKITYYLFTASGTSCTGGTCGLAMGIYSGDGTSLLCASTIGTSGGTGDLNINGSVGEKSITFASGADVSGGVCSLPAGSAYTLVTSSDSVAIQIGTYQYGSGSSSIAKLMAHNTPRYNGFTSAAFATGDGASMALPSSAVSGVTWNANNFVLAIVFEK
jgi:hypothetical protein